jgi:hypothetical protein
VGVPRELQLEMDSKNKKKTTALVFEFLSVVLAKIPGCTSYRVQYQTRYPFPSYVP